MTRTPSETLTEAFESERQLHAFARALAADDHAADDLVQHAWLRAVEHRVRAGFGGFLRRVIRNRAIDDRRTAFHRADRERAAAAAEPAPSAADMAEREQLRRRLADAVANLDEPYRTTVWLRYFEELPPREIARRTGVPIETVRTRLKRVLERLRRELDDDYGERAEWAALIVPWGRAVSAVTPILGLTGLFLMHKTTLTIAASALAVLALWQTVFSIEPGGAPGAEPDAPAGVPLDSAAVPSTGTEPTRMRAAPVASAGLAVRHRHLQFDDGRPAIGLEYWLWDEPRPRQAWLPPEFARLGSDAPVLGEPAGVTDSQGRWAIAGDREVVPGVTFAVGDGTLFSYPLEFVEADATIVLPRLSTLTVRVKGARETDPWLLRAYPGVAVDPHDPTAGEWAATYVYRTRTVSGDVVVNVSKVERTLVAGETVTLTVPAGQSYGVEAEVFGYAIRGDGLLATAPDDVTITVERALPRVQVSVVDDRGARVALPGRAVCRNHEAGIYAYADFTDGAATLSGDWPPDLDLDVRLSIESGETFQTTVRFRTSEPERELRFVSGSGAPSVSVELPEELPADQLVGALIEDGRGELTAGAHWTFQWFSANDPAATFGASEGRVRVSGVPEDWLTIWLFADDGRTARLRQGEPRAALAPLAELEPLDLEARRRPHREHGFGHFIFTLNRTDARGERVSVPLRRRRWDPGTGDLPTWKLVAPFELEPELQMRIGREWVTLPLERAR